MLDHKRCFLNTPSTLDVYLDAGKKYFSFVLETGSRLSLSVTEPLHQAKLTAYDLPIRECQILLIPRPVRQRQRQHEFNLFIFSSSLIYPITELVEELLSLDTMTRRILEARGPKEAVQEASGQEMAGDGPLTTITNTPTTTEDTVSSAITRPARRILSMEYGMTFQSPIYNHSQNADTDVVRKKKTYLIIRADLLIPGDGEPSSNAALVVENKTIAWVGPQPEIPSKYTSAPHRAYTVPYLMPGLWDVHVHCVGPNAQGDEGPGYMPMVNGHPASAGARLARGLWESLQRGYTSLRDVAGFGCEVARAVGEGEIVGPSVYSSGACLSQTAGHGDVFAMPAGVVYGSLGVAQVVPGHFGTSAASCLVDGVDECRRAVRLQIRRGARCIKLFASGGVMSRDDDVRRAQFSDEELRVIVDEAARQGRSVAAHAHAREGILAAARAGVRTMEHFSFADGECIDLIKEKGIICVPTRAVTELLLSTGGEGLDPSSWEKAKLTAASHTKAYKLAIEAGCTIAMGTDTPPGVNMANELEYAVAAGLSSLEAIKAATVNGALTVGAQAPKTGQLKAGYEADVLGLTANPVEDVRVLQNKDNIKWVWKGGKIYKGPGVGPWGEDRWWGEDY